MVYKTCWIFRLLAYMLFGVLFCSCSNKALVRISNYYPVTIDTISSDSIQYISYDCEFHVVLHGCSETDYGLLMINYMYIPEELSYLDSILDIKRIATEFTEYCTITGENSNTLLVCSNKDKQLEVYPKERTGVYYDVSPVTGGGPVYRRISKRKVDFYFPSYKNVLRIASVKLT